MKTQKLMMAAVVAAMNLGLMACTSNGDGVDTSTGGIIGGGGEITSGGTSGGATGGSTGGLLNDGSTPTNVTDGGTALTGNFICTAGARAYGDVTTEVGTGGLVGGPLTALLNSLGGTTLTALLNSISNPDYVIDGNLDTYATVAFTAGLITNVVDSIDESVVLPAGRTVPAGKYAVFGVSFPDGTANVTLLNSIAVTTFLGGTAQESNTLSQNALTLLGAAGGSTPLASFIGLKATKPYDTAQISLTPGVITANVGDALHIHELCTDGHL